MGWRFVESIYYGSALCRIIFPWGQRFVNLIFRGCCFVKQISVWRFVESMFRGSAFYRISTLARKIIGWKLNYSTARTILKVLYHLLKITDFSYNCCMYSTRYYFLNGKEKLYKTWQKENEFGF